MTEATADTTSLKPQEEGFVQLVKRVATRARQTFKGLTRQELWEVAKDSWGDIKKSPREAVTAFCCFFLIPGPSISIYTVYRLHTYRAKQGIIPSAPRPLFSKHNGKVILNALKVSLRSLGNTIANAAKSTWRFVANIGPKAALGGVAVVSTAAMTYAMIDAARDPAILDYKVLNDCNEKMRKGYLCDAVGVEQKAIQQKAFKQLTIFGAGFGGLSLCMAFGMAGSMAPRGSKKSAEAEKPAVTTSAPPEPKTP